ncbi:SLBB domain-containing protein [Sunxiuqinia sp. sy24]|uniref:SLBB domain-containing protein n=1 Tax=Sunxiuqinia sp. sy24 TaxID=3461495 RepID=UPI004045588B
MIVRKALKFIWIIGLLACYLIPSAQVPAHVDVNKLSDQQVQQIVQEIESRGLTMEQATEMARLRGASPAQISQLKSRIRQVQNSGGASMELTPQQQDTASMVDTLSKKTPIDATSKSKKIFGFNFFNSADLTFEPSVNIPIPDNYVLGINDQVMINIWGASQQTYQLVVDGNGNVQIPDLGPVQVAGIDFREAEKRIRRRLVAIYNGMGGDTPNTFAEIGISNLRSIKVNVIGEVYAPGTYTLPATASAFNALYLSGGPNENGSFRTIQVIRQNKVITEIDVYDFLINANPANNIALRDQDILFIPTYDIRVEASGSFKREGFFELQEDENLQDLLSYTGGFADQAYHERLSITRTTGKQFKVLDITRDEFETFALENGDQIEAGEIIDRYENRVSIEGAVFRPGTFALTDGMKLSELIAKADGVKESVFSNRGVIIRLGKDLSPQTIAFKISDILEGTNDLELKREDHVIIQDVFSMREARFIKIYGQVQYPGEYPYRENMSLKDLVFLAGGFTEAASESFIELARRHDYESAAKVSNELADLHQFNISRNLDINPEDAAFKIQPFDYIYVRKAPSYNTQRTVTIQGEVVYPGPYSISNKNERVSDLIKRCGGLTPHAFSKGATLKRLRSDDEVIKESLLTAMPDSLLQSAEQQMDDHYKLELRLDDILKNPGSIYDYVLREGDELLVPEVTQEIKVSGEVLNPIGLAFQENKGLKYYINRSGGFSQQAKKGKVFVIYSDGTTKVTKGLLNRNYPRPEPGCQIVVPQKPDRPQGDQTSRWLSIASAFSSIAIAVAAVLR